MNWLLQLPVIRSLHTRGLLFVAALVPLVAGVLLAGALEEQPAPSSQQSQPPSERPSPGLLSIRPDLEKTPLSYQSDYWEQLGEGALRHLVLMGPLRLPGVVVEPGLVLTTAAAVDPMATPPPAAEPTEAGDASPDAAEPSPESSDGDVAPTTPDADQAVEAGPGDDSADGARDADVDDEAGVDESTADPDEPGAGLVAVDWDEGLALFRLGDPATAPAFTTADAAQVHPGALAAAVTRTASGRLQVSPGHVTRVEPSADVANGVPASLSVAFVLPEDVPVAAIVDLDGDLLGAAIRHGGDVRLLAGQQLTATMDRLKTSGPCYAVEAADISDEIHALLSVTNGVAIERVRTKAFLAETALRPGDVLLEWNDEAVSSVDQFHELYRLSRVGDTIDHVVLRGTRRVSGSSVLPDRHCRPLPEVDDLELERLGLAIVSVAPVGPDGGSPAWQVTRVEPDGPADEAGLTPGDRIVAANGRELLERTVRRTLERLSQDPRAIVFTVQRDGRVKLLAVTPPDA